MSDSLITKRAIAEALKQVCREKPFDKISISNITSVWGLNRQTFYYHFQDKYELLSWIYYNENFAKIAEDITLENWDQKIYELLQNMKEEKAFYINTIKEQEHTFESYLFDMAKALFSEAIIKLDEKKKLTDEERDFDSGFYAYGICGIIVDWVEKGMRTEPQLVAERLKSLAKASERAGYLRSQAGL
ncbi:transcriptional regulator, TetR family [Lacrimispora sphenoides]|jgi:probable dihydroxyacetone kinase regulator|uniref:dihydroxyacetone kinase transcriptional activator DhaS n=1 Tax=Lacrimispora sphenoides TaxID=29370 RepID=UPI0008BB043E|nr:dihydroxyacetone kinase transcriptional activator DhaS [Lacrimispora sphenoides]SET72898.1 transcriptional regulator, TetR family [Lacrimispora sphenoides]